MTRRHGAYRAGLLASTAFVSVMLAGSAAYAACSPAAADDVYAVCTDTTMDQGTGAPGNTGSNTGYGGAGLNNLEVAVAPGATLIGTEAGIRFDTGSVFVGSNATVTGINNWGIYAETHASLVNAGGNIASVYGLYSNGTAEIINGGNIVGSTDAAIRTLLDLDLINTAAGAIAGQTQGIRSGNFNIINHGAIAGPTAIFGVAPTADGIVSGNVINTGGILGTNGAGIVANILDVENAGTIAATTDGLFASAVTGIFDGQLSLTNSGSILGGNNGVVSSGSALVVNSGTIVGSALDGIAANSAAVINSGTISGGITGINSATTVEVNNSGKIWGEATGIRAHTATVTNTGSIKAEGFGIYGSDTANVTNSGSITGDIGIWTYTANINNSGNIYGTSDGIFAATTANINNSGRITGDELYGIVASGTANITNSGLISGPVGIVARLASSITTSGTIVGSDGTAIQFNYGGTPASDTLTVLPGARFGGLVDFGGGADRVNFGPGSWVLNTANFDAALSSVHTTGNPYLVTPNQIIVADLSGFGAMNRAVMDITGWISSVLPDTPVFEPQPQDEARSAFAAAAPAPQVDDALTSFPGALPYAPTPVFRGGSVSDAAGHAFWAKGFGGRREQDTEQNFIGSITTGFGGAIGFDGQLTANTRLGVLLGGSSNRTRLRQNAGETDTDTLFGGAYARSFFGNAFLDLSVIGGSLDNDSRRNIGGGLAFETATASYDGWFVNPELAFGHRFALPYDLTLTPVLKARYVTAHFDGYTEQGSSANLTVAPRDFHALEERAELTLASVQNWGANRITMRATAGALAQQRTGDNAVSAALVGTSFIAATPDKDNVFGLYGRAGFDWQAGNVALFATGEVAGMNDRTTTFAGKGGLRVVW